ncbi:MAG: sugar transferase [bacterium]|nr:sugar transferase [bacterium]
MKKKGNQHTKRKITFYERNVKRGLDFTCALLAVVVFWWLYVIVAILVRIKLGSSVIFKQYRPGLNETLFPLYKFRTMTDEKDENGDLLPDEVRLTSFGKWLRSTSLDELPEAFNIIRGDMAVIGPRPQLVRDMVFMTKEQRRRHLVRPGLSGLAQVNGRNTIRWEDKLNYDLKYIKKITFFADVKIIFQTVMKAFVKQEGINREGTVSDMDFGDYLLQEGKVEQNKYDKLQKVAIKIMNGRKK